MFQRLLRTDFVWRLSGLTYATGVRATTGKALSKVEYIEQCRRHMAHLDGLWRPGAALLEFGCGLGGHLIAVSSAIGQGVGVDINRGFVRHARGLSTRFNSSNLKFIAYDGGRLPVNSQAFDCAFAFNVFERIPVDTVARYLRNLVDSVRPGGTVAFSFLLEEGRGSRLTNRLGDEAYVFWDRKMIERALASSGVPLTLLGTDRWAVAHPSEVWKLRRDS